MDSVGSQNFLEALGRVTVEFQLLEQTWAELLGLAFSEIAFDWENCETVAAALPFRRLVEVVRTVSSRSQFAKGDELDSLATESLHLEEDRNRLLHSVWDFEDGIITRFKANHRKPERSRAERWSIAEMRPRQLSGPIRSGRNDLPALHV